MPYVPGNLRDRLVNALMSAGQDAPPIPIVVAGHFDDALAQQCRPEVQAACQARFAIETVLVFDPASAGRGTRPSPTPFPSPAPSGLFAAQQCAGDVPYSFVGWTTPAELHSDLQGDGHVWAVVTRDVVLIGGWSRVGRLLRPTARAQSSR